MKSFIENLLTLSIDKSLKEAVSKVLETLSEGAIVADNDTRIIISNSVANKAFARFGVPLERMRISEVFRDLSVHNAFKKALDNNESSQIEFEFLTHEKRIYRVSVNSLQINDVKLAIGIFYDITEIERLEKIRQEFLSNVSHELRTPLTSILAFVETLEEGAVDDSRNNRRFLSVIRKNAERMQRLIDDILELSSIESGKINIQPQKINLKRLIDDIFLNLTNKAQEKSVELKNLIPEDTLVFADPMRLEQMLTNLIDNAIKFNRDSGRVEVSYQFSETHDVILVRDTGDGISSDHLPRIFERFYRVDKARTSRESGGTGLGLAIVKHLAKLHGGEVGVSSTPSRGSTFWIKIPRC